MNKNLQKTLCTKILKYYQLNKLFYKSTKQLFFFKQLTISLNQNNVDIKQTITNNFILEMLFFQKSIITISKKSNALLKIQKGYPIGCKLTCNNSIVILSILKSIFETSFLNENIIINFKINKKKYNTATIYIKNIYNFKKLENFYILVNKVKSLNISLTTYSKKKISYKETNFLFYLYF